MHILLQINNLAIKFTSAKARAFGFHKINVLHRQQVSNIYLLILNYVRDLYVSNFLTFKHYLSIG